jgi:hypothetical protein
MKYIAFIFFLASVLCLNSLFGQFDNNTLTGIWHLEEKTGNSPFSQIDFDAEIVKSKTPKATKDPEPFQEAWAFDGKYAYITELPTITRVATYELGSNQLTLNFTTPKQYEFISCIKDTLTLAVTQERFFRTFNDTLIFRRSSSDMTDYENYQSFVEKESLGDFQLQGIYQTLLDEEIGNSLNLKEGEVVALNLRFYPDSTLLFVLSIFQKDAIGSERCKECNKIDAAFFQYPFGVHKLQKEGCVYYFQPEYALVYENNIGKRQRIEESDQVRFKVIFRDGEITLESTNANALPSDEQRFTFIPFPKMNYVFQKYEKVSSF